MIITLSVIITFDCSSAEVETLLQRRERTYMIDLHPYWSVYSLASFRLLPPSPRRMANAVPLSITVFWFVVGR